LGEVKLCSGVDRGDGRRRIGQYGTVQEVPDGNGQNEQQLKLDLGIPKNVFLSMK